MNEHMAHEQMTSSVGAGSGAAATAVMTSQRTLADSLPRSSPEVVPAAAGAKQEEEANLGKLWPVAYFSMEIGHCTEIPTYTGGLGVLAGDTIRAAADLRVPMVAVTLLHRRGYFRQYIDDAGSQREEPVNWVVQDYLKETPARATVTIEGRTVQVRAWRYDVRGNSGFQVPVFFLDTSLPANSEWDRTLTDHLYGGDSHYRLCQEIVLGVGGVRVLRSLGYDHVRHFHINEGHASLLTLELLDEHIRTAGRREFTPDDVEAVRQLCVFTTHTPVPAGHDRFPAEMVNHVLGAHAREQLERLHCLDGALNMTHLALKLSAYVNGVSQRHGEVSRQMFHTDAVDSITNGVHAGTWVSAAFAELFDRYMPQWRSDSFALRRAVHIPTQEIWAAHTHAKRRLLEYVNRETNAGMVADAYTIGFARRAATYKRADLLFEDIERLRRIHRETGPLQIIYAGKAHPHDHGAKDLIRRIYAARDRLAPDVKVCYLVDYDIDICALMTAGCDVWLNTPEPPLEASGTSGMKAALNGVPSLSVLDGWWVEGCLEGVTGWAIGRDDAAQGVANDRAETARLLYEKLEYVVLPTYYRERERYGEIMRHAIAINGSFFSTHRMLHQYVLQAYFR